MPDPSMMKNDDDTTVIPVIVEEASVEKRMVETGTVRVHTRLNEHTETIDEPLLHNEVIVEHVAINRRLEGAPPNVRLDGDTIIIPIVEEVLVVEKRLMLKEELHVRRVQKIVHQPQQVTLRHQEVEIERIDTAAAQTHDTRSGDLDTL